MTSIAIQKRNEPTVKMMPTGAAASCRSNLRGPLSRKRNGFSLVELIVVMVIIGLLASLVAIRTRSYLIASKQNAARAEISLIIKALESFYADQSRYPSNEEGIGILVEPTDAFPDGFLTKVPRDPWKNDYEYVSPGEEGPYSVLCLGADGKEGGERGDVDISSDDIQ